MDALESTDRLTGDTQNEGFMDWLRGILAKFMGGSTAAAASTVDRAAAPFEVEETEGTFVVAPGGYRIRVPDKDHLHSTGEMLPSVRQALAAVPPLPHVVMELLKEVQNPTSTAASVAEIAGSDPALAAALLRTVNSAAFGLNRKVTSITEAISYLGFGTVRSIVVRLRLDQLLPRGTAQGAANSQDLWVHSLAVSYVADCLAERVPGVDRGLASTLGLLHDIGKLAIIARLGAQGDPQGNPDESAQAREAQAFGVDHAGIGANLAHHWGLPADLVQAIRWHHCPEKAFNASDPEGLRKSSYLVQVANELAKYGYPYSDEMELDPNADQACESLGLGKSVAALMDGKVRQAITKAILFGAENGQTGARQQQRFLRMRSGEAAVKLAGGAQNASRVQVDEGKVQSVFGYDAVQFNLNSSRSDSVSTKALEAAGCARFLSPTNAVGIEKLIASVLAHQQTLALPAPAKGLAAFTFRALAANLIDETAGATAEVLQMSNGGKLVLAVKAPLLAFGKRLGTCEGGAKLVEAELCNVLNLDWFESITITPDGSALLFLGH